MSHVAVRCLSYTHDIQVVELVRQTDYCVFSFCILILRCFVVVSFQQRGRNVSI